jgi:hypothetical protein
MHDTALDWRQHLYDLWQSFCDAHFRNTRQTHLVVISARCWGVCSITPPGTGGKNISSFFFDTACEFWFNARASIGFFGRRRRRISYDNTHLVVRLGEGLCFWLQKLVQRGTDSDRWVLQHDMAGHLIVGKMWFWRLRASGGIVRGTAATHASHLLAKMPSRTRHLWIYYT